MTSVTESARPTRISRACDNCYKQKIKCDGEQPRCNWCDHRNISCTYERKRLRAPKVSVDSRITPYRRPIRPHGSVDEKRAAPRAFPCSHHVGNINLSDGSVLFTAEGQKWVESFTGEKMPPELCLTSFRPWERDPMPNTERVIRSAYLDSLDLPDREKLDKTIEMYFSTILCRFWPLLDAVFFRETVDIAYGSQPESPLRVHSARICVMAAWAFTSAAPGESHLTPPQRAEMMATIMASINLLQQPHVELLEATTMLVTFHLFSGNIQAGVISNALAARYLLWLEANTRECYNNACEFVTTGKEDFRRYYHLRNLFWICYQQDKELCLRSGQPPSLSEYNCDLDLPMGYERDYNISLTQQRFENPVFPGDLRLSQIKSKAYIDLYSRRALEKDGALILSDIRQLDADLEQWRMQIPPDYRPTLLFEQDTTQMPERLHIRSLMIRLEYHYCMAYIHQACARFGSMSGARDQEIQGVSSSLTLSIAACRSSLYYLVAVQHTLFVRDFWLTLFYPLSAILTIFCYIISNPTAPEAHSDLDVIKQVGEQIRDLGEEEGKLSGDPTEAERVWKVIMALEGLARRAVDRVSSCPQ